MPLKLFSLSVCQSSNALQHPHAPSMPGSSAACLQGLIMLNHNSTQQAAEYVGFARSLPSNVYGRACVCASVCAYQCVLLPQKPLALLAG